ncbi:MAG: glutamate--tRNA ligase [Planctomycetia bacterium]|nr:glutamate--tRNA ligase [Planctomycetia bacterium]
MTVRTRFAPSPTGYLHIGGVRTALFNWLFARKNGGQFILRIDDTDQGRNQPEALQPILDGFKWLGLDWDEGPEVGGPYGPYYQSQKLARYQEAVRQLLDKGLAYWDYARPEETKAEMEAAEKEKRPKIYSRRWMAETDADRKRFEAEGRTGAVKLKMPREGVCQFHDHVCKDMEFPWAGEQDIVIQRSDGTVTYNLANVVDDFDMKITHVIRAVEHLSNTPRQIFMLEGLGYPRPEYAHLPYVAEPGSKNKLSKRKIPQYLKNDDFKKVYLHAKAIADRIGVAAAPESFNPVLIDFYKQVGYLPAALLNYLVLLGWALENNREDFTLAEMTELFDFKRVNKDSASLDVKKLFAFQARYMQALPNAQKVEMVLSFLVRAGLVPDANAERPFVTRVVEAAGPRMTVAGDILEYDYLFLADEQIDFDPALAEKGVKDAYKKAAAVPSLAEVLTKLRAVVAGAEPFTHDTLKAATEALAQTEGAKAGPLSQVLRVATTGREVGFSAYDTLALLGRDRCLARIDRALTVVSLARS